jgi:hypothetical protein
MWLTLEHDYAMQDLVRQMRQSGVRVVLLSNSWGNPYKRESWSELFDEVIVSGEVGMRKPDIEIYELALERAGHPAEATANQPPPPPGEGQGRDPTAAAPCCPWSGGLPARYAPWRRPSVRRSG